MNSNATQVGGSHYKGTTYQHWDFVIFGLAGRYLEGNITKYIARWRKKNGLQDLQKARHYLTKLIELYNEGSVVPMIHRPGPLQTASHFCDVNGIDVSERMIIIALADWNNRTDLNRIGGMLDALIEKQEYAEEDARPVAEGRIGLFVDNHGQRFESRTTLEPGQLSDTGARLIRYTDEEPSSGYVNQG